jgi:hypothetical protein
MCHYTKPAGLVLFDPSKIGVLNSTRVDEWGSCGRNDRLFISDGREGRKNITLLVGFEDSPARPSDARSLKINTLER